MPVLLESFSTITEKGQTTIPKAVRDALGVGYGGRIAYRVNEDGVSLHRADDEREEDPVLGAFLTFLARDMERRPDRISALTPALARRIAELIEGVEVDPAEAIEGDVAL